MNLCTQSIISGENCGLICNRKLSEDGFCRYHGKQSLDTCSICFDFVSLNDFSKSGIHVLTNSIQYIHILLDLKTHPL